jgi:hypothetical protein
MKIARCGAEPRRAILCWAEFVYACEKARYFFMELGSSHVIICVSLRSIAHLRSLPCAHKMGAVNGILKGLLGP